MQLNPYEKLQKYLIYFLLFSLCFCICYLNFRKIAIGLENTDHMAELDYARLIISEGTIFPSTWVYCNEFMFYRPTLLYALFMFLIKDFYLAISITLTICFFAVMISFNSLCKSIGVSKICRILGMVLILSLSEGGRSFQFLTFLFYGYYAFYLLTILNTLRILEKVNINNSIEKVNFAFVCIMAFLSGIVGIRMSIFLYIPLIIMTIIDFYKKNNDNLCVRRINTWLLITNLSGVIFGKIFLSNQKIAIQDTDITLINFGDFLSKLNKGIATMMQTIIGTTGTAGGMGEMKLFSIATADWVMKFCLFLFVACYCFKSRKYFKKFITFKFVCVYAILILSAESITTFGNGIATYFFCITILFAFVVAIIYDQVDYKLKNYIVILLTLISISNFLNYYLPFIKIEKKIDTSQLVEWLEKNDISHVAMQYFDAGPVEAYSKGKIKIAYLYPTNNVGEIIPFLFLTDSRLYEGVHYVILNDDLEKCILSNANSRLKTGSNVKIQEIGRYNIYKFESDPLH